MDKNIYGPDFAEKRSPSAPISQASSNWNTKTAHYDGITQFSYQQDSFYSVPARKPKVVVRGFRPDGFPFHSLVEDNIGQCLCRRDVAPDFVSKLFCLCCCIYNFEGCSSTLLLACLPCFPWVQIFLVFYWRPVVVGEPLLAGFRSSRAQKHVPHRSYLSMNEVFGNGKMTAEEEKLASGIKVDNERPEANKYDESGGVALTEEQEKRGEKLYKRAEKREMEVRICDRLNNRKTELQELLEERQQNLEDIDKGYWHFRRGQGPRAFPEPEPEVEYVPYRLPMVPGFEIKQLIMLFLIILIYICVSYLVFIYWWDGHMFSEPVRWIKKKAHTDLWVTRDFDTGGFYITSKQTTLGRLPSQGQEAMVARLGVAPGANMEPPI